MAKLKIAWDVDNTWQYQSFRDVISDLVYEQDKYDVYLITKNTDSTYVNGIVTQLGMNTANVFQGIVSNDALLVQLNDSGIQLSLTADIEMFNLTNRASVDTIGIYVNSAIQDIYNINPKWFVTLQFWIKRLTTINGQAKSC
jgi:hypothetical protein